MALIAPSIASVSGSVSAPDAPTLRTQIERVLALQGGLGRQLVDVQVTGGGAGAIWFADMTFAPNGESEASIAVDPATVLVRVVEAIEPLALNVGIFRALTDLGGAGALWIPKVCIAAGGAGAVCLAVVLGSTSPRPLPGGSGGAGIVTAWTNIPAQVLNPAGPVPVPVTGAPLVFPAWTAGDVLDGEIFCAIGVNAPNLINGGLFVQISTDGGATWHTITNGIETVFAGFDDQTGLGAAASVSAGFALVPTFTGQPPQLRAAYATSTAFFIGNVPPGPFPASMIRARRIPAAQTVGAPPYFAGP